MTPRTPSAACAPRFRYALIGLVLLAWLSGCQPREITTARFYLENQEWGRALEQLEAAVQNHPNDAEAHFLLGVAYGHLARFEEMNRAFKRALELSDKYQPQIAAERERYWTEHYDQGLRRFRVQDYSTAAAHFKRAVLIDPTRYEAHKRLALCYLNDNQPDRALFIYQRLLEKTPDDVDLLMAVSGLHFDQKHYDQAATTLERVLRLEPNHRDALLRLARTYDAWGEAEKAEKTYEAGVRAFPHDSDLIFSYAVHRYRRGQYQQAIQLFQQVLDLEPDHFEAVTNIGNAYLSLAETLRKQLRATPHGRLTAEKIHQLKNRVILNYRRAIPYLEQALKLQPEDANLWRNLGIAYLNTGETKKGEEAFLRSEELKTNASN